MDEVTKHLQESELTEGPEVTVNDSYQYHINPKDIKGSLKKIFNNIRKVVKGTSNFTIRLEVVNNPTHREQVESLTKDIVNFRNMSTDMDTSRLVPVAQDEKHGVLYARKK